MRDENKNWRAFALNLVVLAVLSTVLAGCVEVEDHLTVNADGSGMVKLRVKSFLTEEQRDSLPKGGSVVNEGRLVMPGDDDDDDDYDDDELSFELPDHAYYPPLSNRYAKLLFPRKDFNLAFSREDGFFCVFAKFKNIDALLNSPYARAHGLTFTVDGKKLTVVAVHGTKAPLHIYMDAFREYDEEEVSKEDQEKKEQELAEQRKKFRVNFSITLPGTVTARTGVASGSTVSWCADHSKMDAAGMDADLSRILSASCDVSEKTFSSGAHLRMSSSEFNSLREGIIAEGTGTVLTEEQAGAVVFSPCVITSERTFYYTDDSSYDTTNYLRVTGVVTSDKPGMPIQNATLKIQAVTDNLGDDLNIPALSAIGIPLIPDRNSMGGDSPGYLANVRLRLPSCHATSIKTFKGDVTIRYPGSKRLVKFKDIIPKIVDRNITDFDRESGLSEQVGMVAKRELPAMDFGEAGYSNGITNIPYSVILGNATIVDVQVYDAGGKPCQTFLESDGGSRNIKNTTGGRIIVIGKPTVPLSVGLLSNDFGPTLSIPVSTQNLPLHGANSRKPYGVNADAGTMTGDNKIPGLSDAFTVVPLRVITSSRYVFKGMDKYVRKGNDYGRSLPVEGLTVRARLIPPPGRILMSLDNPSVVDAVDDKNRPVAAIKAELFGQGNVSRVEFSNDGEDGTHYDFTLYLQLPQADASYISKLRGVAEVESHGGWLTKQINEIVADKNKELDIGEILPGAKLIVINHRKGGSSGHGDVRNASGSIDLHLIGPIGIKDIKVEVHAVGSDSDSSYETMNEMMPKDGAFLRVFSCQYNLWSYHDGGRLGNLSIVLKQPSDPRKEKISFTMEDLDLY